MASTGDYFEEDPRNNEGRDGTGITRKNSNVDRTTSIWIRQVGCALFRKSLGNVFAGIFFHNSS